MRLGEAFQAEKLSSSICLKEKKWSSTLGEETKLEYLVVWGGKQNERGKKKRIQLERLKID